MKLAIVILIAITAGVHTFAEDIPPPQDLTAEIVKIKAQELSRGLVELKLQEVALGHTDPIDHEKLALVRAQEAALNQELLKLAVGPLENKLQEALKSFQEGHHVVISLRKEIERRTVAILGEVPVK